MMFEGKLKACGSRMYCVSEGRLHTCNDNVHNRCIAMNNDFDATTY